MIRSRYHVLCLSVLGACSGASESARSPAPPVAAEAPVALADPAPLVDPVPVLAGAPIEEPLPEPPVVVEVVALASLTSVKDGTAMGAVSFERDAEGTVEIIGDFNDLSPGLHAFYIHERGDCGNKGKRIGKHLDPTGSSHGPPESSQRHAGDLGNVLIDAAGNGTFAMRTDSLSMERERPDSIIGRAIVVHTRKDSKTGSVGPPLACGVINLRSIASN